MSESSPNFEIDIARDFSRFPGGRYARHGKYSGEEFRNKYLVPNLQQAIEDDTIVVVTIDGVRGFGSSFLEEAFGGLVRVAHFSEAELRSHLRIRADDKRFGVYKELIDRYIRDASLPAAG